MPSLVTVPSRQERHCTPCEHHHVEGSFCGSDCAWREYVCKHPEAFEGLSADERFLLSPETLQQYDDIMAHARLDGRFIGRTEAQPDWCPLERKA